ncbi:hypothetical protein [Thermococcus sp. ES12]|uniref:hypothetical protein n=1 Tax=Thermococcus sp. ES12 TaxID=1638246 RepID=UPI001430CA05|nr:hypothetical protein [Thermococcus sp. ES12]NJE77160.1 hypothetical protein [Thermococcus sp. ES12]
MHLLPEQKLHGPKADFEFSTDSKEDTTSPYQDTVIIDAKRGAIIAERLFPMYSTEGIFGKREMPEDYPPKGVEIGSREHLLFLTLTVAIDYLRNADALWESARKTFEDPKTQFVFFPERLAEIPLGHIEKIKSALTKYKLALRPNRDTNIWLTIALTLHEEWSDDPRNFLEAMEFDAIKIIGHLTKHRSRYPNLNGEKIRSLWLRMLRDNAGINLNNLEKVPIPVDVHITRATLSLGIIRGRFEGTLEEFRETVAKAWMESTEPIRKSGKHIIPLDLDRPLWHLSRNGCSYRAGIHPESCPKFEKCPFREYCTPGEIKIKRKGKHQYWVHLKT